VVDTHIRANHILSFISVALTLLICNPSLPLFTHFDYEDGGNAFFQNIKQNARHDTSEDCEVSTHFLNIFWVDAVK